jgi:SAM-dependent methyltransferase
VAILARSTRADKDDKLKQFIKRLPIIGYLSEKAYRVWSIKAKPFPGSESYWKERYNAGGNSGPGSYDKLAAFKARVINRFVRKNCVKSIIEFGCGDGNQLKLALFPSYVGLDVSPKAIGLCRDIFHNDHGKHFKLMSEYRGETAQLAISLDVIYHLVEDNVYHRYMVKLFDAAERYVIIYSSNTDINVEGQARHIKHRQFTRWIKTNRPHWNLICHIPNEFPYKENDKDSSFADFFIYERLC